MPEDGDNLTIPHEFENVAFLLQSKARNIIWQSHLSYAPNLPEKVNAAVTIAVRQALRLPDEQLQKIPSQVRLAARGYIHNLIINIEGTAEFGGMPEDYGVHENRDLTRDRSIDCGYDGVIKWRQKGALHMMLLYPYPSGENLVFGKPLTYTEEPCDGGYRFVPKDSTPETIDAMKQALLADSIMTQREIEMFFP